MVGVGGRSRGCKTCREARVKCDENRPMCNRCTRLRLKCEGYSPHQTFIDGLSLAEIPTDNNRSITSNPVPAVDRPTTPMMPRTLCLNEEYIFKTHLLKSIFAESRMGSAPSNTMPWLAAIIEPDTQHHTSQLAWNSLAATYYGKLHSHPYAMIKGAKLYTQGLAELQKDLQDAERVLDGVTLANTLFLAVYELITLKDATGWLIHFLGIAQLIKFRGPHRHQSGIGKDLFLMTRSSIAVAYLINKKRCFLEESAWKNIPWATEPDSKTTVDYLLDVFCDMPGIIEDMTLLIETNDIAEMLTEPWALLALRVKSCLEQLYQWRGQWQTAFQNSYYHVGLIFLQNIKSTHLQDYPFQEAIFFKEPDRAAEICYYNSMLILLHRAWNRIPLSVTDAIGPPQIVEERRDNRGILLNPGEGSIIDFVYEISRTVYYQLFNYPGTTGAFRLMFPLGVAYRNAESRSELGTWLSEITAFVADSYGFEAAKYATKSKDATIII